MRRSLLWFLVMILVISMVATFSLIGCKGGAAPSGEAEEEISGEIKIIGWEGYDLPLQPLVDKYDIEVKPTYISNNDEIFTKLKAGAIHDILTPNHSIVPQLIENDLIIPIDTSKVPNLENLFPQFKEMDWNKKDGEVYTVIFTWGSNCINYNPELIDPIDSWHDLLEPDLKGKYVLLDDTIGVMTAAAKALGYREDTNLLTTEQLDEAGEFAKKMVANALAVAPSVGEIVSMFINGEIAMWASGWEAVDGWVQAEGVPLTHNYVKEGTLVFVDSYAISANATNLGQHMKH